jgi:hypothetical protein
VTFVFSLLVDSKMLTNKRHAASTETVPVRWKELAKPKLTKTVFSLLGRSQQAQTPMFY